MLTALVSPSDPIAAPYGGRALKAEKSRNVSAGIVFQPLQGVTITADYYHIRVRDRIGITPQITLPAGSPYTAIQFLINGYDTKTDGLDIVASLTRPFATGRLGVTAAYSHNRTKIVEGNPLLVTNVLRPIVEDRRPKDTATITTTFDGTKVHLLGRVRYYGSFVDALPLDQSALGFENQRVSPRAFVDLSLTYDITQTTHLTAGAENILNTYPDRTNSIAQFVGFKYPAIQPYGEDGGRWYVRLTKKL